MAILKQTDKANTSGFLKYSFTRYDNCDKEGR